MADPVFPITSFGIGVSFDSKQHAETLEDPSMSTPMEGGYVVTRAKHTRTPRKSWSCGIQQMRAADKLVMVNFWNLVRGGSVMFDWVNPDDAVTYQVRFKSGQGLTFKYVGAGALRRWDCSFTLEQA